eukprot:gene20193-31051_t
MSMVVVGLVSCTALFPVAAAALTSSVSEQYLSTSPVTPSYVPTPAPFALSLSDSPSPASSDDATGLPGLAARERGQTKMPMASSTRPLASLANYTEVVLMFEVDLSAPEGMSKIPAIASALEELLQAAIPGTRSVHILWACEINLWHYCYYASDLANERQPELLESTSEHWSFGFDVDTDTADMAVKSAVKAEHAAFAAAVGQGAVFLKVGTRVDRSVDGGAGIGHGAIAAVVLVVLLCAGITAALVFFARHIIKDSGTPPVSARSDIDASDLQEDAADVGTPPEHPEPLSTTEMSTRGLDHSTAQSVIETSLHCSAPFDIAYGSESAEIEMSEHLPELAAHDK